MKALDNMNRKPRGGGGGYRGGKRRSPSPYSDYSRSYSDDSYRKKGRKSRSASAGRKGKRDSRSAGSKSEGSYRQYSKHSEHQGSPRGEIEPGSAPRSKSAGSQGPKPEENGHAEDKKQDAPVEEAPAEVPQKD